MARNISMLAPEWWDYTTLDDEILKDAEEITEKDLSRLARPGFVIKFYDTLRLALY